MDRRTFLVGVAAVSGAGCLDVLTRPESAEPAAGASKQSLSSVRRERVGIVSQQVTDEPAVTGVVVNFRDERVNAEVVAEFYREDDGDRETVSTETLAIHGLAGKQGERFVVPFPPAGGPEDGILFDLDARVTAVLW